VAQQLYQTDVQSESMRVQNVCERVCVSLSSAYGSARFWSDVAAAD